MAENPVNKLARLMGGVAMLPGPLGYKVLGQLLLSRSSTVEVAAANVALATVSHPTNAAVQIAVRSVAPAFAAQALYRKEERRLEEERRRLERIAEELEQQPNATARIAVRSMLPAVVVDELNRQERLWLEEVQRLEEARQHEEKRRFEGEEHLAEVERTNKTLSKDKQKLGSQINRLKQEMQELRSHPDEYAPAKAPSAPEASPGAVPAAVSPETKATTGRARPAESLSRGKRAITKQVSARSGRREPAAAVSSEPADRPKVKSTTRKKKGTPKKT
jgi:vacuolar-type H+-ATPase subunit I/STV1